MTKRMRYGMILGAPLLATQPGFASGHKNGAGMSRVLMEVLPLSPNDDRLRPALYHAIYGHSVLQTLSVRAAPPIHIIVENGSVTLEGVVPNDMQKKIAGVQANSVSGVFSVTNKLSVESKSLTGTAGSGGGHEPGCKPASAALNPDATAHSAEIS